MDLTRGVPPEMLAALEGVFYPILFVHLDWPDAPVFVHSGAGEITWGGRTWQGVGPVGMVSIPEESMGSMATTEAQLSLIASPEDIDAFIDDAIRNRAGTVYLGLGRARGGSPWGNDLVSDPVSIFYGMMDQMGVSFETVDDGVSSSIRITLATGPGARSSATAYHSEQDQTARHPSDTAGRLVVLAFARAQALTWPES